MVHRNLKLFQADYRAIAEATKHEKALLSESLSSEQNPQNSSSDLRPTPAETAKTENIPSSLLKSIPILQEQFMKLEMEIVQLRETVLKQQQSHTCAAHITPAEHRAPNTQQTRTLQTEKDSYQCELTALRLQLQDREQSTLEMRQQLREIQEEIEQQNSEIQALKEQVRELLLAKEEPAQTHRAQTLLSTPKSPNTESTPTPQRRLRETRPRQLTAITAPPLSGSPAQQHQPSSQHKPAQRNLCVALLP